MLELSKPEKKIARQLIDKGLQAEYKNGISKLSNIISKWDSEAEDHRDTYMKLYKTLTRHDKHIGHRYDDITGSRYLITIAGQLADKTISVDDLDGFRPETREAILFMSGINRE